MATTLNQVIAFSSVAAGATVTLPHTINVNGLAVEPDLVYRDNLGFSVGAVTATTVTVTNTLLVPATCNVWLEYQYSTSRAYGGGNPPLTHLTPNPFIVAGAAAVSGGGGSTIPGPSFVFRPGGVTAGNVFATWPALMTAVGSFAGPKSIFFDTSIVSPAVIPAGGPYDMTNVTWLGLFSTDTAVTVADGATFTNLRTIASTLLITYAGAGTPAPISDLVNDQAVYLAQGSSITTTGSGPFIRITDPSVNGNLSIIAALGGGFNPGSVPVLDVQGGGVQPSIAVGTLASIGPGTLSSSGGASINLILAATSGTINESQPAATIASIESVENWTLNTQLITSSGSANPNSIAECDPTGGPLTVTINPAFNSRGNSIIIKNATSSTNGITVAANFGDTIDGAATLSLSGARAWVWLISDGVSNWNIASSSATAGAAVSGPVFVFRPGGVAAGNVYTTWASLVTAIASVSGIKWVQFDDSIAPCIAPPGGPYDMTDAIWIASSTFNSSFGAYGALTVQNGASFTGLRHISNHLQVSFEAGPSPVADLQPGELFTIDNGAQVLCSLAGSAFIDVGASNNCVIILDTYARVVPAGGGWLAQSTVPNIDITVFGGEGVQFFGSNIKTLGTGKAKLVWWSTSAQIDENQSDAAGGVNAESNTDVKFNPQTSVGPSTDSPGASDYFLCDPSAGAVTLNIPPAFNRRGNIIVVKNSTSSTANPITLVANGGDTVEGAGTYTLNAALEGVQLMSDGANAWNVISQVTTPSAGSGGTQYTFVFQPGGTALGNVFTDWNLLVAALSTVKGPKIVEFETTFATCIIPSGGYDMTDVTWVGTSYRTPNTNVSPYWSPIIIQDGATFTNLRNLGSYLDISFQGTVQPAIADFGNADVLWITGAVMITCTSTASFIDAGANGPTIQLSGLVQFIPSTSPVVTSLAGGDYAVVGGPEVQVDTNTLTTTGGGTVNLHFDATSTFLSEDQPGVIAAGGTVATQINTVERVTPVIVNTGPGAVSTFPNQLVLINPTTGARNLSVPLAFNNRGQSISYKNTTATVSNLITLIASGVDNIDGAATVTMNASAHQSITLTSDGVKSWAITARA